MPSVDLSLKLCNLFILFNTFDFFDMAEKKYSVSRSKIIFIFHSDNLFRAEVFCSVRAGVTSILRCAKVCSVV